jgi:hypothetical protein
LLEIIGWFEAGVISGKGVCKELGRLGDNVVEGDGAAARNAGDECGVWEGCSETGSFGVSPFNPTVVKSLSLDCLGRIQKPAISIAITIAGIRNIRPRKVAHLLPRNYL